MDAHRHEKGGSCPLKVAQLLLRRSRSYGVVWNSHAACWWWLFQMWEFQCNMVVIYSPDGTNVYGSRGGSFRPQGQCTGRHL